MKTTLRTLVTALVAAAALVGCSEDSTSPTNQDPAAPNLPPAETLRFDFAFFDDQGRVAEARSSATAFHWFGAVTRVFFINTAVVHALFAPHLAFALAINTVPSYQGDNEWLWVYTWVDPDGREIQVRLLGFLEDEEDDRVNWEPRVSDTDPQRPLDNALWFRGESNLDGAGGYWVFHDAENDDTVEMARIDYTVESSASQGNESRELQFANIDDRDENVGDTLTYDLEGDVVSIIFFDAGEDFTADITWDESTGAGSILWPDHNNGERGCWDETLQDIECEVTS